MVATSVLVLGIVLIFEAFFFSLNILNYCSRYLEFIPWVDEKMWQAKEEVRRLGSSAQIPMSGIRGDEGSEWGLSHNACEGDLYEIDMVLSWQAGPRRARITRNAYVIYEEKK
jgi:hypothetical protein